MSFINERRHPRFEFQKFGWVFSIQLDSPSWPDRPLRLEARNISQSGLKFVSNRKVPIFEQVKVILYEGGSGKELSRLTGKVVRLEEVDTGVGERTYGIALEFLSAEPSLANLLPDAPEANSLDMQ